MTGHETGKIESGENSYKRLRGEEIVEKHYEEEKSLTLTSEKNILSMFEEG